MKLVWRRAHEARGLLLAAVAAALVAIALVTGLADYNRRAVDAGQRALIAAAPVEERSLLVSGSGGRDHAEFTSRDRAVRDGFRAALGDTPVRVAGARYGTGRELTGDLGPGIRTGKEPVFATLATLDDLPGHADLVDGAWPTAGAGPLQATLPEKVAAALGLRTGDRVPMRDRSADRRTEVLLSGTWRPRDPADPYWRLAPGLGVDPDTDASHGPFVLDPADFATTFPGSVSASWVVAPDLAAVGADRLPALRRAVATAATEVPETAGLGSSAQAVTTLDRLIDRISRADLAGRSALATPLLLIVVLGGYALVLIAALLHEDRRAQTALLRARGAARRQLAGLAAREATLVVVPAALLGPLLAGEALRRLAADGPVDLGRAVGGGSWVWAAALATAVGCLVAMVAPTLRGAGTYVADLAARSRPDRVATVSRAGLDLALVAFAVLAWVQLRSYSSPLAGAGNDLGIDPLLVAAPTLGVLAGAVVALRLLPPATRFAERFVDRRLWTATIFGMWQAGRRPHAGPVLLLALAVGGSTLAWSLVATGERSQVDQADHTVGADLRLVERSGVAPVDRAAALAALPGVDRALPAWRDDIRVGREDRQATVLGLDTAHAAEVVKFSDRLADRPARELFAPLAAAREPAGGVPLPADARSLTGTIRTPVDQAVVPHRIAVSVLLTRADGVAYRLPVTGTGSDGRATGFRVTLPAVDGLRLAGFEADGGDVAGTTYALQVRDLRTVGPDARSTAVALTGRWQVAAAESAGQSSVTVAGAGLTATHPVGFLAGGRYAYQPSSRFAVVPDGPDTAVPALMTPAVRAALNVRPGETVVLALSGVSLPVRLVGEVTALPATAGDGVLFDLPAATDWLIRHSGTVRPVPEWWLRVDPAAHAEATRAVAALPGTTLLDRRQAAAVAADDPYWQGARTGLLAAALGSVLLALVGLVVDVWATARHRIGEFSVLHTLGASPRLLARALLAEQTFLAGIGVGVGLLLGAAVGATMAPLVVLTPAAGRPVPAPAFALAWTPIGWTVAGLLLAALAGSAAMATGLRRRVAVARLRNGGDR
ncbi:FtsX-like permease family protein [Micromonospora matsumotoense]|uniref:FtsX-like permease family protein n=1 Tax=Micromonospora matsumotoense TaxID=121616 RepID=A0A1C5A0T3_9ACTN|nr:FtsX-like permease family protein [Micromonospora matsumotoense]SCF38624.1 FtsX-like permease family protein [Micromonospora matsumotoense]